MTIFSGHSVISRVYTSRFGNGTARWNLDRSGTKKVSGTRYSTQWKTPQKWTVPYRTVPYHAVEKRQYRSHRAEQLLHRMSWAPPNRKSAILLFSLGLFFSFFLTIRTFLGGLTWSKTLENVHTHWNSRHLGRRWGWDPGVAQRLYGAPWNTIRKLDV